MLVKDPLCPWQTGYEAFGLSTDAGHEQIMEAFRKRMRDIGPTRAAQIRRQLCVPSLRIVEDILCYVDDEAAGDIEFSGEHRKAVIDQLVHRLETEPFSWLEYHTAAVLSLWWSCNGVKEHGEELDQAAWNLTVALWPLLLSSKEFWSFWTARRGVVYAGGDSEFQWEKVFAEVQGRFERVCMEHAACLPPHVQIGLKSLLCFEFYAIKGLSEIVVPFLLRELAKSTPINIAEVAPGLAIVRKNNNRILDLATAIHHARPQKGKIISQRRWEGACDHLLRVYVGADGTVRTIAALVCGNCPQTAIEHAKVLFMKPGCEDAFKDKIRYLVAMANLEVARTARCAGANRINDLIESLENALSLFSMVLQVKKNSQDIIDGLFSEEISRKIEWAASLLSHSTIEAAIEFTGKLENDVKGCTRAIVMLERAYHVLKSEGQDRHAEEVAKNIAMHCKQRSMLFFKQGEMIRAKQDLDQAISYDPEITQNAMY
ncbi:MAG TPA: hypothetical protein PLI09_21675 [Candidatus Hydrogenedentes bacterium]|nr:hypothetical protein [Candidatus Hydrogenedentota bacterium]